MPRLLLLLAGCSAMQPSASVTCFIASRHAWSFVRLLLRPVSS